MTVMTTPAPRRTTTARLEVWRAAVNRALAHALPPAGRAPQVVHEGMRYCVLSGGKRFRPLLCLGGAAAAGGATARALPVACALELLHAYSLVHDDLPAMDNADERRGQATCHRKYGEGNAILIGDALLTRAFELLAALPGTAARPILQAVTAACGTEGLIGGQVLDLQMVSQPRQATAQALQDIAARKTGALITASVVAGGLAAAAPTATVKRLTRYGEAIGLAFQLIDDLHDRDGMAVMLGLDEARRQAHHRITRAVDAVAPLGRRAEGLREIARWLAGTAGLVPGTP